MRGILATLLASLAVLYALFVPLSEDRGTPSGLALMQREKTSDAEDRLTQAIMLDSGDDQIIPNLRVQVRSSKRSKL